MSLVHHPLPFTARRDEASSPPTVSGKHDNSVTVKGGRKIEPSGRSLTRQRFPVLLRAWHRGRGVDRVEHGQVVASALDAQLATDLRAPEVVVGERRPHQVGRLYRGNVMPGRSWPTPCTSTATNPTASAWPMALACAEPAEHRHGEFDHILMEDIYWRTLDRVDSWVAGSEELPVVSR